jgi:hypothetical protein
VSESSIRSGIATAIKAMTEFADTDVVINDWSVLDKPAINAPYVIIETSDNFDSRQDTMTPNTTWQIPIILVEKFTKWSTTLTNLSTRRQAIIDKINSGTVRSAGGLDGVTIDRVYNDGDIIEFYRKFQDPEKSQNALPVFLMQRIILEAEEY